MRCSEDKEIVSPSSAFEVFRGRLGLCLCVDRRAVNDGAADRVPGSAPAGAVVAGSERGQSSLLRLDDGDVLATHWAIEEGQGRILTHRLRVEV